MAEATPTARPLDKPVAAWTETRPVPVEESDAPAAVAGRANPLRAWLANWGPALPLLILAAVLLGAPVLLIVVQSFRAEDGAWSLAAWQETLTRRGDQRAVLTSLSLGVSCASVSLIVGGPVAWRLSRASRRARAVWLSFLNVAANFGGVGLAFGFTAVLGTYGMATLLIRGLGIDFIPPGPATFGGLLIAYLYTNIPLLILLVLPAMGVIRREWEEAATVCAATRWQFWRYIGLPVLAPFLAAGWLLTFTWTIGIYSLAYALAGNAATSPLRLMTLQIGVALNSSAGSQERAAVMAVLLLLFATVSLSAYRLMMRWAVRWSA